MRFSTKQVSPDLLKRLSHKFFEYKSVQVTSVSLVATTGQRGLEKSNVSGESVTSHCPFATFSPLALLNTK